MKTRKALTWPLLQRLVRNVREITAEAREDAFQMVRTSGLEWMHGFRKKWANETMILLGHCGNCEFVRDHTLINLILGIYSRFVEETLRLDNQKLNAAFAQNLVPRA